MDYTQKLTCQRFRQSTVEGREFNEEMESDRGRAINSAAIRRLQQKTQVFPLETNSAVRSRLTHSLEVQQTGRYIAKLILAKLENSNENARLNLQNSKDGFISAIEMACLLHDIGNPPFGHFGEEAICSWSHDIVKPLFNELFKNNPQCNNDLEKIIKDLCNFEGNAQALRTLHSLQALNLTYTQLACLIKYTRAAHEEKPQEGDPFHYRKKKPGFYLTEEPLFEKIKQALSIGDGCRFPLTYIMEAADDISYCIADIDDAVEKGILSIKKLNESLESTWKTLTENKPDAFDKEYFLKITGSAYADYKSAEHDKEHKYILKFRTTLVNDLSKYAAQRYIDNHESIFNGNLDESLLEGNDKFHIATETLRTIARKFVFTNKEVEDLELKGYAVIAGLLNIYSPLLKLNHKDFQVLVTENSIKGKPIETRLYHKLSSKHKSAYLKSIKELNEKELTEPALHMFELYHRTRLITDYISGMTDNFALDEYKNLSASI